MKIGIDIDNVISSFDNELLKEYLKYDKNLRNTVIINENADYIRRGMFDWSEEEEDKNTPSPITLPKPSSRRRKAQNQQKSIKKDTQLPISSKMEEKSDMNDWEEPSRKKVDLLF